MQELSIKQLEKYEGGLSTSCGMYTGLAIGLIAGGFTSLLGAAMLAAGSYYVCSY